MLIEITQASHDVIIDLRYGTTDNFTHQIIYQNPKLFLHETAHDCLLEAIKLAAQQNLKLKLFDGFRPQKAQEILWQHCPNEMYIMPPNKGSVHTRGAAIDLTLVDEDENELDMGTPFDSFQTEAHHGSAVSKQAQANRYLLLGIMSTAGFDFYKREWWHYQLFCPTEYPLIEDDYGIMGNTKIVTTT